MSADREIGVANVTRCGDETLYGMTDEFGHYCGQVTHTGTDAYAVTDKYGTDVPGTNPLYRLMVAGVIHYRTWAAKH